MMHKAVKEARLKGSISKKYSVEDRAYVAKKFPAHNPMQITTKIKKLRQKYIDELNSVGEKLAYDTKLSLDELEKMMLAKGVSLATSSEKAWQIHEKDVVKGVIQFLNSGLIEVNGVKIPADLCNVSVVGGGVQSDVCITNTHNNKKFFIECKLNFDSARYFKYVVSIDHGKMKYSHQKYIDGVKSSEQVKELNDLFTKCIDITSFINDILKQPEVKASWEQFGKNIDDMCYWLKNADDLDGTADAAWKELMKKIMIYESRDNDIPEDDINAELKKEASFLTGKYPQDFAVLENIFDKYVKYYKDNYNAIIDHMIKIMPTELLLAIRNEIGDDEFQLDDLKIDGKSKKRSATVSSSDILQHINRIISNMKIYHDLADEFNDDMMNSDDFDPETFRKLDNGQDIQLIAQHLFKIEIKLNAILKHLGADMNDFAKLDNMKRSDKLKYLFKLFLSSTARKRKNQASRVLVSDSDESGNMSICQPAIVENSRLAQMITDFYVKKDGCAYIQIADRAYIFDERHNPLGLSDMPVFKDCMTKFEVGFTVTDTLKGIHLSIRAFEPSNSSLHGKTHLSFIPKDSCFICKVLTKPINVKIV